MATSKAKLHALPHFDFRIDVGLATSVGKVRKRNEDAAAYNLSAAAFALADGMGGHAGGDVASKLSVTTSLEQLANARSGRYLAAYAREPTYERRRQVSALVKEAVRAANSAVIEQGDANLDLEGMGSTLDVLILARDRAFVGHVGDSRVYLLRRRTTLLMTQDHGLYERELASGRITMRALRPLVNPLVNAIGMMEDMPVDDVSMRLAIGDRLVLCSDGVHGYFQNNSELGPLVAGLDAEAAAHALVNMANARGGRDNSTALVVDIRTPFIKRSSAPDGVADMQQVQRCPLFAGCDVPQVLAAMQVGIEMELPPDEAIPQVVTGDRVAYVIIAGTVASESGRMFGPASLLYGESLVNVARKAPLLRSSQTLRVLRFTHHDIRNYCEATPTMAGRIYRNLAAHLARSYN